jgi:selenocysteine lyase/cysteine desulfurase
MKLKLDDNYHDFLKKNRYISNKMILCDQTASNIPLKYVENFLTKYIYPYYTNTHSNNYLGRKMAEYIKESREYILQSVNGNCEEHCVIFDGAGASGVINHLVHLIKPSLKNAVVFVSIYEHYSNYLPWEAIRNETGLELVILDINSDGLIDLDNFESKLKFYSDRNKIASLSACSNVTGVIQDTVNLSKLCNKYNTKLFFDYAASAPYVKMDIRLCDAIFLSPHKFPGGHSTPGLLICKKILPCNKVSYTPSGGTVRFCSKNEVVYSGDIEIKESGGTPNIIGIIKTGLIFRIKDYYIDQIIKDEHEKTTFFQKELLKISCNNLIILNPVKNTKRLPIFAIQIKKDKIDKIDDDTFYHYNYIVALLSDLFNIYTRGGVSCAGIFAQKLLDLNDYQTNKIKENIINNKGTPSNYGWCRITLNSIHTKKDLLIIIKAIKYICKNAYKYEDMYKYNSKKNIYDKIN